MHNVDLWLIFETWMCNLDDESTTVWQKCFNSVLELNWNMCELEMSEIISCHLFEQFSIEKFIKFIV